MMASYHGTSDSVRNAVTTDTWEGQLDFGRACTGSPERMCWLCTELTPWNRVMHGLGFELVELRPGKLRLQSMLYGDGDIERERVSVTAAREASFLVSWLLEHHRCIDELKVAYGAYPVLGKIETPFTISLRPAEGSNSRRTLRGLEVEQNARFDWLPGVPRPRNCYELKHLDAVGGLERLKLAFSYIAPKFAAELAKLLRRHSSSIKRFEIINVTVPRPVNHALRYLFSCESLTISAYLGGGRDRETCLSSLARLVHSSTALKELTIVTVASTRQIAVVAKELETNTSLTKLGVHIAGGRGSPEPLFTALQANTTLRELRVSHCTIRGECGHALSLLLRKNTGLRLLYFGNVFIAEFCLVQLAAALTTNTTLESLHIWHEMLPVIGIVALCKALRVNKTLKELLLPNIECPEDVRAALARQLTQDDFYGRVQLPWTEPDLPGLTAALTSSLAGLRELRLPDVQCLFASSLKLLFDALASNKSVRTLSVRIEQDPGERGGALCEMLKVNQSIDCLDLAIDEDRYKFVREISRALAVNAGITEIMLGIDNVRNPARTATALAYLLAHNKTATEFFFHSTTSLCPDFVERLAGGMLRNKIIVKFGLERSLLRDDASFRFFEAVRRNRGALNRAVDFVVSPILDRQCAEGFELFSGRPYFLKHLKKVTGKTEPEALLATAAAERYLLDNYLRITGIVRHSVKCHPARATQVDALNADCWLTIVRHLKVTDVLT